MAACHGSSASAPEPPPTWKTSMHCFRASMSKPKVMLLDEPSMGLAPIIVQEVFHTIRRLKETGITLLLVEQFAKSALEVADYAYEMDRGHIAIEGTPAHLREDERVLAAYLG